MIDESFRLTPVDVRRREFRKALRGYDPAEVDAFRDQVAEELEKVTRQVSDLDAKSKGLIEQLRAYRERDKALNDALVSAQQLRSEIRDQVEREAQLILREARAEGERLVEGARAEVRKVEADLSTLEKTRRAFIGHLRALAERQLHELDAIAAAAAAPEAASQPAEQHARPPAMTPAWLDTVVKE
jgi:DivIVA domain-containing protein